MQMNGIDRLSDAGSRLSQKARNKIHEMDAQAFPHRVRDAVSGETRVNVGRWERMASMALGAVLIYRALKNRRWSSLLLGGSAISLFQRGLSGSCAVYRKAGISSVRD